MPAVGEVHSHERVARLEHCHINRHVRRRSAMRLDISVLGAVELLHPVNRKLLNLINNLASAIVSFTR